LQAPGFKKIFFAPEPGGGLTSAECRLETPQGRVECRWKLRGKTMRGAVTVPARTTGELRIPGQRTKTLFPGRHNFAARIKA
jgi:alpha-L-rhamnosidase